MDISEIVEQNKHIKRFVDSRVVVINKKSLHVGAGDKFTPLEGREDYARRNNDEHGFPVYAGNASQLCVELNELSKKLWDELIPEVKVFMEDRGLTNYKELEKQSNLMRRTAYLLCKELGYD